MSLLIKNGNIVTADRTYTADIFCESETITSVGLNLSASPDAEVIDASGNYVFPGFIDPHVHAYLPLKETTSKDDYYTTSLAAVMGGTTCFIDFCSPERNQAPLDAFAIWNEKSHDQAVCDYSYHMAVTRFDDGVAMQLQQLAEKGVTSLKVYLAYKDTLNLSDKELLHLLHFSKETGLLILGHCENADVIDLLQKELLAAGKTGPEWHYYSRPPQVESDGVLHLLSLASLEDVPIYIVHLSCKEALDAALLFRQRGCKVNIETMPHYLLLDKKMAETSDFEGAKYVLSPPLREKENQVVLWQAIKDGVIQTVGTDHAPFDFSGQKTLGRHDFTRIPNGIGSIENRIQLLYTYGVCAGYISLSDLVRIASTNPARVFGLYPRKGTLEVGSDADIVIWDPDRESTISSSTHHMNVDYNPYEGFKIKGGAEWVFVRGRGVVKEGEFVGEKGYGRFVRRQRSQTI